ncbi:MAG: ribonuclease P protein component [Chitinophagales bacterium]
MTSDRPRFTFHKVERLKSKKIIDQLFDKGRSKSKVIYPFRIVWFETELPTPFPVQFMVSVPKRSIPKANNRNLIKRQIKEAYRQNKHQLYGQFPDFLSQIENEEHFVARPTIQVALLFIYLGRQPLPYSFIYGKMCACIRYLSNQYTPKK